MKKSFLILVLIHCLAIAAQAQTLTKNAISTIIGIIDKRDLNCASEIERAKTDFKSKEVFYYIEPEGYPDSNHKRHFPFLSELLEKKGIQFSTSKELEIASFWMETANEKYPAITNCYYKASNELLDIKYGYQFTRKIEQTADSLYVISRINDIFDYPNEVDAYCMIYPKAADFLDQKIQIQKDFFSNFKFPAGFIHLTDKRDFIAKTMFIINRDDKVSDIRINIEFENPENQKFNTEIVNQLISFIENAKWKAAVSSGVKVNSSFKINFYNEII
ncbi:hypothetical protein [Flavobacterium sp. ENC]|uniref:hypothetical protein n=1 Tax=Flavobacterium sp. ENC TaxID=2897330 RepID=UPI001E501116|nr:hypothetical protein [Flavobacterium sp. ENC]MCD0466533.1 hypothetical protein [Flavobacterium sp. ENC]